MLRSSDPCPPPPPKAHAKAICFAVSTEDFDIQVYFDDAAECQWPQLPTGVNPVRLPVIGGQVRIDVASERIGFLQLASQRRWQQVFGDTKDISMCGFIAGCCRGGRPLLTVCKQLVWAVAQRLEDLMDRSLQKGHALPGVKLQRAGWSSGSAYALRRRLGHYLSCCRTAVGANTQYISVSTDKSRVHALGLQNTMVCFPDNVAFWAPPQASAVHQAGGRVALRRRWAGPRIYSKRQKSIVTSIVLPGFLTYG